ncbi:nucleoside triphosphate hydrolase [Corynebacterium phocae]|uniref:Nucleoside triphosphate hydrolase n=1 Tax=Corynebacterium phocae TaxID=161895 RepID=A0A1L7D418_9CORY|nr:MazG nucleotide pyrophosphohydrolase domain-containing protein [Corynebacterium phocae]APT92868.1 nucleoside triphosphate hydrolase [Corynebacterium phocae]KAA8723187.1 nucleoside triphosphate hydrolase [Corynebacterium phocae]
MTVVLLDERWPTLIPLEVYSRLTHPVRYTGEVPVEVRWNLGDLATGDDPRGIGTLVSTDARDPEVARRLRSGEPVIEAPSRRDAVYVAKQVMRRARSIGEWEMAQTHQSLLPYLEEETAEFSQAIRQGADDEALVKELGDVFLQVLFHAEIASRRGAFELEDVARSFVAKMRARAPYLFDGTTGVVATETQERLWEEGKRAGG